MASRQQRTELTIHDKLEIIKLLKEDKCTQRELQQRYKVSKDTISRILLSEDQLRDTKNSKMRRMRKGNNRLIDEAVSKWYRSMLAQNSFVNGPLLRQQAVKEARLMNNNSFEATNGWLWRWQKKENVKFNISHTAKRAAAEAEKATKDAHEFDENKSYNSFEDMNTTVSWQPTPTPMQNESGRLAHSEVAVKEEVNDMPRNPFEVDVVFNAESDEQAGYGDEAIQNIHPVECSNIYGDEIRNDQHVSMDHESYQGSNVHHQPNVINKEPNEHRNNNSQEESEMYRLANKRKSISEKDPPDMFSIYGEYIAHRLRASANEREIHEIYVAQHNIDDIIFKLSMGSYARPNESSSSKNHIGQSIQTNQSRKKQTNATVTKENTLTSNASGDTNGFQDLEDQTILL